MRPMSVEVEILTSVDELNADGMMMVIPVSAKETPRLESVLSQLPGWLKDDLAAIARKRKLEPKSGSSLAIDGSNGIRKTVLFLDPKLHQFDVLVCLRKVMDTAVFDPKVRKLLIDVSRCGAQGVRIADAVVSAAAAKLYKFPKYKTQIKSGIHKKHESDELEDLKIGLFIDRRHHKPTELAVAKALQVTTSGTNLVRWLAKRAGNDLTCKTYTEYLKSMARMRSWHFKKYGHEALTAMKAGAFLAVVKGSHHREYGIIQLTYRPRVKSKQHLALVGKGLVFDTGGHSLKPSAYMLGMHGDMAGSAVALAVLNIATLEKWPINVTAYLAVADNMIGPLSYKPNDVVSSMKGTTIEVIDTDAEGRMVLADTLYLAAKSKPALIMDFATLTGACVRAIGTTYAGVFTNRSQLHQKLIQAGVASGERVWPFPMDKDFAECLESTVADLKQCREKGGVDHIEAAQFLMHFVGDDTPWVHVDLSAIEHAGGLGHVPSDETGFGVRFATSFVRDYFTMTK
jgi:leucyl aminopeptidase